MSKIFLSWKGHYVVKEDVKRCYELSKVDEDYYFKSMLDTYKFDKTL